MVQRSRNDGADHSVMREVNRSLVLDLIKQQSPISRASIAKATSLAKPTVSAIVDDLLSRSLVREIGVGKTSVGGGRPPIMLAFNSRSEFFCGVQIGVRRTTVVVADGLGAEIGRVQHATPAGRPLDALTKIASEVQEAIGVSGAARKRLSAVGVGVPGLVDIDNGVCLLAPNLGWRDVGVAEILREQLGVPIFIHNTAQASAVAETLEGASQGAREVVLLYAGTGIGAGIITGGHIYHGSSGIAGEIGHCRIPEVTLRCNCGKVGCLETVASGPAIAREAERLMDGCRTAEDVARAAEAGDRTAVKILGKAGRALGVAASWLINLFNPEVLVIGGGLAGAGKPLLGPLRETALELALPQAAERVRVLPSALGQDAEVRGAVLVARQSAETYYKVIFQG